ncbi:hypothetical protein [Flavilitoribacter nigricans]|nr:hypothetical protein [Flavilitoribacter nigricans]
MEKFIGKYAHTHRSLVQSCFALLVLSVLSIFFGSTNLIACSCPVFSPGPRLVQEHIARYEVVFIGKVIKRSQEYSTFEIIRHLKGLTGKSTVTSAYFDSCSTLYDSGYHIVYGNLKDTLLNTSYCSCNESLKMEDYGIAGAHDTASFESLLKNGIERYNFHVFYLKSMRGQSQNRLYLSPVISGKDWYRSYTIYHSMQIVLIGLLLLAILYFLDRRFGSRQPLRSWIHLALTAGLVLTLLSIFIYGESRPIGIPGETVLEMYGFPKFILSRNYELGSGAYTDYDLHLINLIGNLSVYAVLCALCLQLFFFFRTVLHSKNT